MNLVADIEALLNDNPDTAALLGIQPRRFEGFADLAGTLLASFAGVPSDVVRRVFAANPGLVDLSSHDIAETARRNFEPGGTVASLLFARGVHAVMAHRVAHQLWQEGEYTLALAVKSSFGRAFSTDNVTLGSTLSDSGPQRHPTIRDNAVIGAGAIILGNVTVGAGANVAAGAIVITDVAPASVVVGAKSRQVGPAKVSFGKPKE